MTASIDENISFSTPAEPGTPHRNLLLWVLFFFQYAAIGAYFTFLNIYFKESGLSGTQIGLMGMIGSLVSMACAFFWGYLSDRTGKPNILIGSSAIGALLAPVVPGNDLAFWLAVGAVIGLGLGLLRLIPERAEPNHRSPLPAWIKLPVIAGVILALVVIKNALQGFMTVFPFVGVVAAYEARSSLWTLGRQVPVMMSTLPLLMATCHLAQPRLGLGPSLALGWVVFLGAFVPMTRGQWAERRGADMEDA